MADIAPSDIQMVDSNMAERYSIVSPYNIHASGVKMTSIPLDLACTDVLYDENICDLTEHDLLLGHTQSSQPKHWVVLLQERISSFVESHKSKFWTACGFLCAIFYAVYFVYALIYDFENSIALLVITIMVLLCMVYMYIRDNYGDTLTNTVCVPASLWIDKHWHYLKWLIYTSLVLSIAYYLIFVVITTVKQFQSVVGLILCILVPLITCKHPKHIKWRPVLWGLGLQFALGIGVLRWKPGYEAVKWLSQQINKFLFYSLEGAAPMFGDPVFLLHAFLMLVIPLVVWVGVMMTIFFHFGLIQIFAAKLGWLMKVTLQTTAIESISLAANIFLSVLDTMIMLRKYMPKLTKSEFHCFLVGAHSTIAGFAFGLFVLFGVKPQHLLTGAVMSAPAAVAIAKLNWPETEESQLKNDEDFKFGQGEEPNVFVAGTKGAWEAGKSAATILIQVVAFVSLIIWADEVVMWIGARVGWDISLSKLLAYVFMPVSYLIGIEADDLEEVSAMLGIKVVANEFLGFLELGKAQLEGTISDRSGAIATYAMCGFSSFGTFAMFIGVWSTVDPDRTAQVAREIPRLMMNSNLACFTTACIASIFYSEEISSDYTPGSGVRITQLLGLFPRYEDVLNVLGFPNYQ